MTPYPSTPMRRARRPRITGADVLTTVLVLACAACMTVATLICFGGAL